MKPLVVIDLFGEIYIATSLHKFVDAPDQFSDYICEVIEPLSTAYLIEGHSLSFFINPIELFAWYEILGEL